MSAFENWNEVAFSKKKTFLPFFGFLYKDTQGRMQGVLNTPPPRAVRPKKWKGPKIKEKKGKR